MVVCKTVAAGTRCGRSPGLAGNALPARRRMQALWAALLIGPCFTLLHAQSTNAPLNEDYYHSLDRYEIKSGRISPELFTTVKPYKRNAIVAYIDSLEKRHGVFSSRADRFNRDYFLNDNWEWSRAETANSKTPLWKGIYRKQPDFAHVDTPELDLHVSPVLLLGAGRDSRLADPLYTNTRGIEIRGMVDKKIGFYSFLITNQMRLPSYVQDEMVRNPVVPHEGFWKTFKTGGVDFFQARAYIDWNVSKSIWMQFGHDRMFIGNGVRSLVFSDFAPPHLYWRTNVKVWKINYLFQINRMVAQPNATPAGSRSGKYPEKFVAFHHASINIGKKLNVGFFESVVFSPADPAVPNNSFELNYLNPVIFYRAVEHQFGSADNVILGADFKWNAIKKVSFYGQFVLDEFLLDNIRAQTGWWANKFAAQLGGKYIDAFGIANLDLQGEVNVVRPYTYTHNTAFGSYTNFHQAIAHPLGANFTELVGIVRYQPLPRLHLSARTFLIRTGRDRPGENWGADLLKNSAIRQQDFGNTIGQGAPVSIWLADFTATVMLKHNLFFDVKHIIRNSESELAEFNTRTAITSVALRLNLAQRLYDF
jgi:hypothetical protein